MSERLNGKVAFITGGASGIGEAAAFLFGEHGAKIIVADIDEDAALRTSNELNSSGIDSLGVQLDVPRDVDIKNAFSRTNEKYGPISILVNSAGLNPRLPSLENKSSEEIWDRIIDVNLKGTYLTCKNVVQQMEENGGGSIVNLSSIMGEVAYHSSMSNGFSAYNPSKGGVLLFTKNLAVDLAPKKIRVNCLNPGFAETPFTEALTSDTELVKKIIDLHPIGRLAQPKEIAYCALFLASDESSFVTGTSLLVDGGYTAQ